jgi:hypothetical protein
MWYDLRKSVVMLTRRSVSSVALQITTTGSPCRRDHHPKEETYSHASRESDRNGNDTFHRPNVKDETRAGERADDLNLGKMRSGAGPCELRSIPARCLCRLVRLIHSFA